MCLHTHTTLVQPTGPPNPEPQVADNQQPTGSSAADNAGGIKGWGLQACLERALAKELPPHVEQSLLVLAGNEQEQREWSISGANRSQLLWSVQYSFIGSQSSVTTKSPWVTCLVTMLLILAGFRLSALCIHCGFQVHKEWLLLLLQATGSKWKNQLSILT